MLWRGVPGECYYAVPARPCRVSGAAVSRFRRGRVAFPACQCRRFALGKKKFGKNKKKVSLLRHSQLWFVSVSTSRNGDIISPRTPPKCGSPVIVLTSKIFSLMYMPITTRWLRACLAGFHRYIRQIKLWLEELYAGSSVPAFEVTPQSLEILSDLRKKNIRQQTFATDLIEDYDLKAIEYQMEADKTGDILDQIGLSVHALSQSGSSSLKTIVNLASLLQVRDTSNTSLLLAISELGRDRLNIEDQRRTEQRLAASLFSKTKMAMVNCHKLNKILEDLENQAMHQGAQLQRNSKQTAFLRGKVKDYKKTLQNLQIDLTKSGVEPSIYHHNLVKKAEDLQSLRDKLNPMKAHLDAYQKLPPDLTLAKVKLEEAKQDLAKLETELSTHINLMHM